MTYLIIFSKNSFNIFLIRFCEYLIFCLCTRQKFTINITNEITYLLLAGFCRVQRFFVTVRKLLAHLGSEDLYTEG